MTMLNPIDYTAADVDFVREFEARETKESTFWTADECTDIKARIKAHYRVAQGNTCCYCRQVVAVNHARVWDTEHVVPRNSHPHFMFTPRNLALACPDCNGIKSDKQTLVDPATTVYPASGDGFVIVHPHFDSYAEHIEKGDYTYARLSDKGEWTIKCCNLNRFAGRAIGWPDPITDDRFEEDVDDLFYGNVSSVASINSQVQSAVVQTVESVDDTTVTEADSDG